MTCRYIIYVLALLLFTSCAKNIIVVAHRGASFDAPENTISAVNLAFNQDADAVEIDIHLSKDNKIVVIHDNTTKRVSGIDYVVKQTLSDTLMVLDVGSWKGDKFKNEKIPYLNDVLKNIPSDKKLVIELKSGSELVPYLKEELGNYQNIKNVIFIAFDWNAIINIKKEFPENKALWLCGSIADWDKQKTIFFNSNIDGLNIHFSAIDKELSRELKKQHKELWSWTIDDKKEIERLQKLNVKGITTNKPLLFKASN